MMKKCPCRASEVQLHLVHGISQAPAKGFVPAGVNLELFGCVPVAGIKKKTAVRAGTLLAVHPSADKGDLFSPIDGVIAELSESRIAITAADPDDDVPPVTLPAFPGEELRAEALAETLKAFGVDTGMFTAPCDTLIVNGFNPDPSIRWAEGLLASEMETLRAGAALLRRLSPAARLVLAVPHQCGAACEPLETVVVAGATYPAALDELVICAVTGKEAPEGVRAVGIHALWGLGRVALTGLPLTETVLTVARGEAFENLVVPDGTHASELLARVNAPLADGDTLVLGGALRGEALSDANRGVTKSTYGLVAIAKGKVPPLEGANPCVSCGECVAVCPARLDPGRLSQYMEFGQPAKCRAAGLYACMECGLCTFVCRARRPVMQYLRRARRTLAGLTD